MHAATHNLSLTASLHQAEPEDAVMQMFGDLILQENLRSLIRVALLPGQGIFDWAGVAQAAKERRQGKPGRQGKLPRGSDDLG